MGCNSRRLTRLCLLIAQHRLQRLSWAWNHIDWSLDDWKTLACLDKSRFQLVIADGKVRLWHKSTDGPKMSTKHCASWWSLLWCGLFIRCIHWVLWSNGTDHDKKSLLSATCSKHALRSVHEHFSEPETNILRQTLLNFK